MVWKMVTDWYPCRSYANRPVIPRDLWYSSACTVRTPERSSLQYVLDVSDSAPEVDMASPHHKYDNINTMKQKDKDDKPIKGGAPKAGGKN